MAIMRSVDGDGRIKHMFVATLGLISIVMLSRD